jgi:hypothetical protein
MTDNATLFTVSAITICIDEYQLDNVEGRIYTPIELSYEFKDTIGMLLQLDMILDRLEIPKATSEERSFFRKELKKKEHQVMTDDTRNKNGSKGTFVVQIQYRQNATWQGLVTWAEKDRTLPFRSDLELLKIIDSALDEKEAGKDK